jgi:hypothetical protein
VQACHSFLSAATKVFNLRGLKNESLIKKLCAVIIHQSFVFGSFRRKNGLPFIFIGCDESSQLTRIKK